MLRTNQICVVRRLAARRYSPREIAAVMKYDIRDVRRALKADWLRRYSANRKVRQFAEQLAAERKAARQQPSPTGHTSPVTHHESPATNSPAPVGSSRGDRCPLCGAYSFDGATCHPVCDPGNLRRAGIELTPLDCCHGISELEELHTRRRQERKLFRDTKSEPEI
ncbi:MAG: hypothetical protein AB7U73_08295 [Pirellulales bacterium]